MTRAERVLGALGPTLESDQKMRYIGAGSMRKGKGQCSIATPQTDASSLECEKPTRRRVLEQYNPL